MHPYTKRKYIKLLRSKKFQLEHFTNTGVVFSNDVYVFVLDDVSGCDNADQMVIKAEKYIVVNLCMN